MVIVMEQGTIYKEIADLDQSTFLDQFSVRELVNFACNKHESNFDVESKNELFKRGKDEIVVRIEIKKMLKNLIHDLELTLKDPELESMYNKETIKSFKNKFLTLLSVLDSLQLEWQKYDLRIRK